MLGLGGANGFHHDPQVHKALRRRRLLSAVSLLAAPEETAVAP